MTVISANVCFCFELASTKNKSQSLLENIIKLIALLLRAWLLSDSCSPRVLIWILPETNLLLFFLSVNRLGIIQLQGPRFNPKLGLLSVWSLSVWVSFYLPKNMTVDGLAKINYPLVCEWDEMRWDEIRVSHPRCFPTSHPLFLGKAPDPPGPWAG